jgi:biopolymer transport protein ExbB
MEETTLFESIQHYYHVGGPLMAFMALVSLAVLAIGLERLYEVRKYRRNLRKIDERVVEAARRGDLEEARRVCEQVPTPLREVFAVGLDRALGRARGIPAMAMHREQRRAIGRLRTGVWILGSAGALMPFVGLLGTVIGVMGAFRAIGIQEHGGFSVVSSGISEALVATAVGLAVALESVILYNSLQNAVAGVGRDLGLLVDETSELLQIRKVEHVESGS